MIRYECPHCGRRFKRGGDNPPGHKIKCPKCGRTAYTYAKPLNPPRAPTFKTDPLDHRS